jgi:hypothetical protein
MIDTTKASNTQNNERNRRQKREHFDTSKFSHRIFDGAPALRIRKG